MTLAYIDPKTPTTYKGFFSPDIGWWVGFTQQNSKNPGDYTCVKSGFSSCEEAYDWTIQLLEEMNPI